MNAGICAGAAFDFFSYAQQFFQCILQRLGYSFGIALHLKAMVGTAAKSNCQ